MKAFALTIRIIGWSLFVLSAGSVLTQDYPGAVACFMLFIGSSTIATRIQTYLAAKDAE